MANEIKKNTLKIETASDELTAIYNREITVRLRSENPTENDWIEEAKNCVNMLWGLTHSPSELCPKFKIIL